MENDAAPARVPQPSRSGPAPLSARSSGASTASFSSTFSAQQASQHSQPSGRTTPASSTRSPTKRCTATQPPSPPPSKRIAQAQANDNPASHVYASGGSTTSLNAPLQASGPAIPSRRNSRTAQDYPKPPSSQPSSIPTDKVSTISTNTNSSRPVPRPFLKTYKSASAVPTVSTTSARSSGTTTPTGRPPSSGGSRLGRDSAMATHDGLNPHSAADLLRQAMMQSKANHDDDHDGIGSNSSTPPGAATPRPDPTDKRYPSIISNYFGQVRDSLQNRPKPPEDPPAPDSSYVSTEHTVGETASMRQPEAANRSGDPLQMASSVSTYESERLGLSPPLLAYEKFSYQESPPKHEHPSLYPTPPMSSSSSIYKKDEVCGESASGGENTARASSEHDRQRSTQEARATPPPSRMRRHTFAISSPLSSIVTAPSVLAAHISNPALQASSTTPNSPVIRAPSSPHSRRPSPDAATAELKKLTSAQPKQSTPPQTPRALSHDKDPTSSRSATPSEPQKPARMVTTKAAVTQSGGSSVNQPKGKLVVSISEGKGLRPSTDPYVVCQFQWNEYISDGPEKEKSRAPSPNKDGFGGVAIRRTDSDYGRGMAIPMRSRQSSNSGIDAKHPAKGKQVTDPKWNHEATFDVVGDQTEIDVSVYDRSNGEAFLGHVRFCPNLVEYDTPFDGWFRLESREGEEDHVTGEIRLRIKFQKIERKHYGPEDFQILRLIGKGTFGQVFQVRKKDTKRIYAMKVLSKKVIVQKKEVVHTLGERNILVRTAMTDSPFIVGLKFSFQTPTDLYLVTDYMSGGELFWHLQKEGRFHEGRAKFYIAELILALQHLHDHDIVYRDLKPENILLDANGHIALCDFGLSKANLTNDATTNTFCGTTEYLAPEVLLDEAGYTKMVDFWSLGVLVFEMCCGWSPFYAEDTQQMYKNIAFGKVRFPRDALSTEGRNFVKGLLNRNPKHRLGANNDAEELKAHPFFADVDWDALGKKNVAPPFKPKLKSELDVSNFDPEFTNALNNPGTSLNARAAALASGINPASTPLSPTMQAKFKGFTFVDESAMEKNFGGAGGVEEERMDEDEEEEGWEDLGRSRTGESGRMSGVVEDAHFDME